MSTTNANRRAYPVVRIDAIPVKTKEALARAAGGVLFIDEAYYLFPPDNERDYGQEVIEILLTEMENERGDLVVVSAGYPDRMSTSFAASPG